MQTPPFNAATWPSNEVPVPKAMTGVLYWAQSRTMSDTSSVLCAKATASGALGA